MSAAGIGSCWSERGLLFHDTGRGGAGADVLQRWQDQSSAVFCSPDNSLETRMVHLHCQYLLFSTLDWCHYGKYLVCGTYMCRVVLWNNSWSMRLNSSAVFFWLPPESSKYQQSGAPVIPCSHYTVLFWYNWVGLTMVLLHSGNGTKMV